MISPESARWLIGLLNDTSVSLGRSDLLEVAVPAAKARAELFAVIEHAAAEQAAEQAREAEQTKPAKKSTPKAKKGGDA